ncbi:MAG TPA: four helix bundle protein [Flavisolibacter sp.]|nr:four helix bundle protein [Flavisolibacter sp.]
MRDNVLRDKSYAFAIAVVQVVEKLMQNRREYVLSKQLLRSGTAIGALIREAEFAQSRADFAHKLSIALKEANETQYWISLLKDTNYLAVEDFTILDNECSQLIALLVSSIKTVKQSLS